MGVAWQTMTRLRPSVQTILDELDPGNNSLNLRGVHDYGEMMRMTLTGIGIVGDRAVIREKLAPDAPALAADRLHGWVWDAARPMWQIGQFRQALMAAATSINAHVQAKIGRKDISDDKLFQEALSSNRPAPGKPRLRVPGSQEDPTVQSRQRGVLSMATGCVWAIRNPAAHLAVHETGELDEQTAFEHLATLSGLARMIDECVVVTDEAQEGDEPGR